MIVVKGVRRIGKSSLIRVGLNKYKVRLYVILDARSMPVLSSDTVFDVLENSLASLLTRAKSLGARLAEVLSRIEGVSIAGLSIRITQRSPQTVARIIDALDRAAERLGEKIVLVFDEAQEFTLLPGFARLLAHIYDYKESIKIVLAGSEIGLLDRLLGRKKPSSPLYGRPYLEITMERLPHEKAVDFLEKGFAELGIAWPRAYVEEAVSQLDGIPGWLTAYGYYSYTTKKHGEALRKTLEEGATIVKSELEKFLSNRGPARTRYLAILGCLSLQTMTWTELKKCLETKIGRTLNKSQYTRYLHELQDYSFIEKKGNEYTLADPLIRHALRTIH